VKAVILDAGPLVAWLCAGDSHHAWAAQVLDRLPCGALVCEAVLAEVCHLVAKDGLRPSAVLRLVEKNDLVLLPLAREITHVRALLDRYVDVGMDLGDACVVRLAELHPGATVCTTDSDFRLRRQHGREAIPLLAPFEG
jgi:predicted nucleic acid-binding protein